MNLERPFVGQIEVLRAAMGEVLVLLAFVIINPIFILIWRRS